MKKKLMTLLALAASPLAWADSARSLPLPCTSSRPEIFASIPAPAFSVAVTVAASGGPSADTSASKAPSAGRPARAAMRCYWRH